MYNRKYFRLGKTAIMIGALAVALLFISSATAVPQVHGSAVVKKLDEVEKIKSISNILSKEMDISNLDSDEAVFNSVFMLAVITEQIIFTIKNPDSDLDVSAIQRAAEKISMGKIDEKNIISKTQSCLGSLSVIIDEMSTKKDLSERELSAFKILKIHVLKMRSLMDNDALNLGLSVRHEAVGLLGGVFKLVVLLFAGAQSMLTLTAFFVIYMGIMSKTGLKLLAAVGAPIFASIVFRLIPVTGSLLGSLSLAVSSLLALLLIFAIPLIIILVIVLVIKQIEDSQE